MTSFFNGKNLIVACLFTGIYDVNRNVTLEITNDSLFKHWAESILRQNLSGVLFHNNIPEEIQNKYRNQLIHFVQVDYDGRFNPNVYRYSVYNDFLNKNAHEIENLFMTDVSDVVVVNNPFVQPLFGSNPTALFCGDEPKKLANEWMQAHSTHLRATIPDYAAYEETFQDADLLNCGIIGGKTAVVAPFINELNHIHQRYNEHNTTAYTGDMGAFNYLVRTRYNDRVIHGFPVNSIFKAYQTEDTHCWFRHK